MCSPARTGRLLGYIWSALASGNAIDEQRLARSSGIVQESKEQPDFKPRAGPSSVPDPHDSDSDRDPNDIVPTAQGPRTTTVVANDPYASDEDDYLDFM